MSKNSKKQKTSKPIINNENSEDQVSDDELTKENIESILKKLKQTENNIKGTLKSEITNLKNEITELKTEILSLQTEKETLQTQYENLKKQSEIDKKSLTKVIQDTKENKNKLTDYQTTNCSIIEYAEDRVNRQLRKTLIFKGIPEKTRDQQEENKKETWDETADILATNISEICQDIDYDEAWNMVERCHRSRPSPR